jgi:hypothetical protein
MDYYVWKYQHRPGLCSFAALRNVDSDVVRQLTFGEPVKEQFPEDASFRMRPEKIRDVKLGDQPHNVHGMLIASPALCDFLKAADVTQVEYLPVKLISHKGKVVSEEYSIVNPTRVVDAIDQSASQFKWNALDSKAMIVSELVLDQARLKPKDRIFRLKYKLAPIIVRGDLAEAIQNEDFVGPYMQPLADYAG